MDSFTISFRYNGSEYTAMVTPLAFHGTVTYAVTLESQNQEGFLEVIATAPDTSGNWSFKCTDGQQPPVTYDKDLLAEIGEAIEKKETDIVN